MSTEYNGKTITPADIDVCCGASFINCTFDGSFAPRNFAYAYFESCTFDDAEFIGCNFAGAEGDLPNDKMTNCNTKDGIGRAAYLSEYFGITP